METKWLKAYKVLVWIAAVGQALRGVLILLMLPLLGNPQRLSGMVGRFMAMMLQGQHMNRDLQSALLSYTLNVTFAFAEFLKTMLYWGLPDYFFNLVLLFAIGITIRKMSATSYRLVMIHSIGAPVFLALGSGVGIWQNYVLSQRMELFAGSLLAGYGGYGLDAMVAQNSAMDFFGVVGILSTFVVGAVLFGLNAKYFHKRKGLFGNQPVQST